MSYIDTKYLGKCETCRNFRNGKCNTYCDHGEEYSPNFLKIPTADVVEVVRCKDCKYWKQVGTERHACYILGFEMDYDEYCSYGERKKQG